MSLRERLARLPWRTPAAVLLALALIGVLVTFHKPIRKTTWGPKIETPLPKPVEPPKIEPTPAPRPANRFRTVVELTLIHEGGATYTNHPADPGGPTKWGVTIWDVRKHLNPAATAADVRALTKEQALTIYKANYWDRVNADCLAPGVDYVVFDYAVNAGVGRATRALQTAVGVKADGEIGPASCAAAAAKDPEKVVMDVSRARMRFQMGLPTRFNVFKNGWRRRIQSVEARALSMVRAKGVERAFVADHIPPQVGPGKAPGFLD